MGWLSPKLRHSTIPCICYDILFQYNKSIVPYKSWNYFFFVMAEALVAFPHSDLLWIFWQMCLWLLVLSWWDMLHVCFSRDLDLLFSRRRYISYNQLSGEIESLDSIDCSNYDILLKFHSFSCLSPSSLTVIRKLPTKSFLSSFVRKFI